jgi:hypothetical protein
MYVSRAEAGGYPLDCTEDVYQIARDVSHKYSVKGGGAVRASASASANSHRSQTTQSKPPQTAQVAGIGGFCSFKAHMT